MRSYEEEWKELSIFPDNIRRALIRAGIINLKELANMSDRELKKLYGIGPATVKKIHSSSNFQIYLAKRGITNEK